ncbi:uncharacterized protein LOC122672236 [Telopea speciosissima]|uniref:uncharacterized protein LOC122672236 n=1 Tax=Telopea speciosissima TaxID=54955 RepID=UPI001CC600F0|nr:uncharacterized protein LOC122672236 [Telopea speciosissima]
MATASKSKGKAKVGLVSWSNNETAILVRFMVDNVRSDNKSEATFNKNGWDDIHTWLEATLGRVFDREQIRNKFNKMRIEYGSFKSLLQMTGSILNEKSLGIKGLSHWHDLQIIFGDSYTRGDGGVDNTQDWVTTGLEDLEVDEEIPTPLHNTPTGLDNLGDNEVEEGIHTSTHNQDRTPTAKQKWSVSNNLSIALGYVGKLCQIKIEKAAASTEATSTVSGFGTSTSIDTSILGVHMS